MRPGACKLLATLLVSVAITGCKLTVSVGEGGMVQSASKTRNCAELNNCTFEVSAANFEETFTAVALPGYTFERWQAGPGYLCLATPGPACTLSNIPFKDIPSIMAIIASDAVFTIKPVFKASTDSRLVVKDANGRVLGQVMDLKNGTDVAVRQVYIDKDKQEHGYMVDVSRMYLSDTHGYFVYWLNAACSGKKAYALSPTILEPLLSNRYVVARRDKSRTETLFLLELSPPENAKVLADTYAVMEGACKAITTKLPLVEASILDADYRRRYTPPFGVYAE